MAKQSNLAEVNLLDLTPKRLVEWTEENDVVVLQRPQLPKPWRTPFKWFSAVQAPKRLRLDDIGTSIWKALDGRRTVGEVAGLLETEFGARVDPVEERLATMIRTLHRERYLNYEGIEKD